MTRRSVAWALLFQSGLILAAYAAIRPMASYRAIELHAGNTAIGALSASFSVLPLLLAFMVGRQADRFGPGRLIVAGSVVFTVAGVLAATAGNLPVLLVASALLGLGQLICLVGQQSTVAVGRSEARVRGFGLLTSAGAAGQTIGPLIATFAASRWAGVGGVSAATVGIAVGTALAALSGLYWRPLLRGTPRPGHAVAHQSNRQIALGMVGMPGMGSTLIAGGLVLTALDLLFVFLPAWADDQGISVATVGWLLALRAAVTLVVRLVVDRMVFLIGRRMSMMLSIGVAGVGLTALPFVNLAGAVALMVLLGLGLGVAQPLTMSWVADAARPGTQGAAMGLRLTVNRFTQTVLPLGVGAVASGAAGVFWAAGGLLTLSAAALLRLPRDHPGRLRGVT